MPGQGRAEGGERRTSAKTKTTKRPAALMDPTVLGKIIWLRPSNKFAIMFGGRRQATSSARVSKHCKEKEDEKKKSMGWTTRRGTRMQSELQEFDPRVIAADAVALSTVRLANQSFHRPLPGIVPLRPQHASAHADAERVRAGEVWRGGRAGRRRQRRVLGPHRRCRRAPHRADIVQMPVRDLAAGATGVLLPTYWCQVKADEVLCIAMINLSNHCATANLQYM